MADSKQPDAVKVNIRPGVSILSVLKNLNYKPWYAIAEFVDNSVQSFLDYHHELVRVEGESLRLRVEIEWDPSDDGRLVVRDNAAGIHERDYPRAFRPAEVPPDRSGLSEFGMGMKSAACWLAERWTVRTKALGEPVERTVAFDIARIVKDSVEELTATSKLTDPNAHYTEITMVGVHNKLAGRTLAKIKEHLASIYRIFEREGQLVLTLNGVPLPYHAPEILRAPYYKTPDVPEVEWRKDLDIDLGQGRRVWGFAAIRKTGSTTHAGFGLFRRKRLIYGSGDEPYRPDAVFGHSNSYVYQRLFGELHLEGFAVSHTKDAFQWAGLEDELLKRLKKKLNEEPLPLLDQADGYRVRAATTALQSAAKQAADRTANVIHRDVPAVLGVQIEESPDVEEPADPLPAANMAAHREIAIELNGQEWLIVLEVSNDPAVGDWLTVHDKGPVKDTKQHRVEVRISAAHPFMVRYAGIDTTRLEPLVRVGAALGLAEVSARHAGAKTAGTIRRNINELLIALAKP